MWSVRHTISNDVFEIVRVTPDLYDQTEALFMNVFPNHENICKGTMLKDSPLAMSELRKLVRGVLPDGISFAMRHVDSNRVVAICCNKIMNHKKGITLDAVFDTFSSPQMYAIDAFLTRLETEFNVFTEWQVECAFEIEFLAVDPKWSNRGLGYAIAAHTLDFARAMGKGTLQPEVRAQLSEEVREERPELVMAVFTTIFTQKCGEKLGFVPLNIKIYSEFGYDGKTFADRIDPIHKHAQFAALRL